MNPPRARGSRPRPRPGDGVEKGMSRYLRSTPLERKDTPLPTPFALRTLLLQLPNPGPVGALIRSMYPADDPRSRAALVLALYKYGRPLEERLKLIVQAIDLLAEHIAASRATTTAAESMSNEAGGSTAALDNGGPIAEPAAGSNTQDQAPASPSEVTETASDSPTSEAMETASDVGTAKPRRKKTTNLRKLMRRVVASPKIGESIRQMFHDEEERRKVIQGMSRFGGRSLERVTFLTGIIWCLDGTLGSPTSNANSFLGHILPRAPKVDSEQSTDTGEDISGEAE